MVLPRGVFNRWMNDPLQKGAEQKIVSKKCSQQNGQIARTDVLYQFAWCAFAIWTYFSTGGRLFMINF